MKITTNTFSLNANPDKTFRDNSPNSGQLNFCAMKKSQFRGFEREFINRFKAPIEKFNSKDDFKNWAHSLLDAELECKKYQCDSSFVNLERNDIIDNWRFFLQNDRSFKENPALSLIIAKDIVKDLSPKNRDIPPILYPKVLIQALRQIRKNMARNKGYFFNFNKIYKENLRAQVVKDADTVIDTKNNQWVKSPSAESDFNNLDINV